MMCDYFKGKRITVMGLGVLGRGVGDVAYLADCGAKLTVTDLKTKEALEPSLEMLTRYSDIAYVLGEHRYEDFENCDMVLKAAGVPLDSPYIAHAREKGVPIEMSAALFARLSNIPIIGVTGTRGKSTVTHLIHHTIATATKGGSVLLGGNVRGVSNLALLREVTDDSIAVMELDSWQLQGFGEQHISPYVAVFTNFMDDHLDYYHNDRSAYFHDKAQIFLHQEAGNVLVTTPSVFLQIKEYADQHGITFAQDIVQVDGEEVPDDWQIPLTGAHNRENVALAVAALRATSLSDELIREGIESFPGVPGRLEYLGEKNGVAIYNDNNATTPAATTAALKAVGGNKNVVLIMGGADKGIDTTELLQTLPSYTKYIALLAGSGTDTLKDTLKDAPVHETLKAAVNDAFTHAQSGDVLLFSPGFASFGMFQNEYDRNDQFVKIIESL